MLGQAFAVIDLLAAVAIAGLAYWAWNPIMWIAYLVIGKAIYSLATGVAAGFYFDVLGWLDLAAGLIILLGLGVPYFFLVPLAKAIYSMIMIRM